MASPGTTQNPLAGVTTFWQGMSMGRRLALGTLVLFFGFAVAYVSYLGSEPDFAMAFSGLDEKDASRITQMLDEKSIPYELGAGGTAIKVPVEHQHKVRLMAAGEGLTGSGVGFELFDQPRFGMTPFEMKMNYRRALEGELRRTISSLEEVSDARIHVVLPKKATFREDDQEASASVVLTIARGRSLNSGQVSGVVNLVSSSIEGLEPERVTILDQSGKTISAASDPMFGGSGPMMDFRRKMERDYEGRLLKLLESSLGSGNVQVNVKADVGFRKVERVDERHDQGAVIEEQTHKSMRTNVNEVAQGVPGARANAPGGGGGNAQGDEEGLKTDAATRKFRPSTTIEKVNEAGEEIKRLNVAVMVNGTYEGEGEEKAYKARSEEEMAQIEALVKGSIGFDAKRGDMVVVTNMAFMPVDVGPVVEPGFAMPPDAWPAVRYGVTLLLALMLLIFVVRPLVKAVATVDQKGAEAIAEREESEVIEATLDEQVPQVHAEAIDGDFEVGRRPTARRAAMEYATEQPRKTAQILRVWLLEDGGDGVTLPESASDEAAFIQEQVERQSARG